MKCRNKILFIWLIFFNLHQYSHCNPIDTQEIEAIKKKAQDTPAPVAREGERYILKTSMGDITLKLFPQVAPNHASNFKRLVIAEYYDNTLFHRIIKGYIIQGGDLLTRDRDPDNDGTGGPGFTVAAEFSALKHTRGMLSMARAQDPGSAGSQFFIMLGEAPFLDQKYTVFGKITQGFEVLEKISSVPVVYSPFKEKSKPIEAIVLYKVLFVAAPVVKIIKAEKDKNEKALKAKINQDKKKSKMRKKPKKNKE